ncbi:MAG: helix-turn-helix transcriptional regulator [Bryobacteraceae bacterium]|jgi:transcriptional regulator with XRE-family HTH domain
MNFRRFHDRLRANLRQRVRSGEITERGLARLTGVSQPHIHNVLKGKRLLSPEMADRVLDHLRMDLLDLLGPHELLEWRGRHEDRLGGDSS